MRRNYGEPAEVSTEIVRWCPACHGSNPLAPIVEHRADARYCTTCGTELHDRRVRLVSCSCQPQHPLSAVGLERFCGVCGASASMLLSEHDRRERAAATAS